MIAKRDEISFPFKLSLGEVIPLLSLPSNMGKEVSTWDFKQLKNIVIFFNHGIKCNRCRSKINNLNIAYSEMRQLETEVLAVSFNSVGELEKQALEDGIAFPLLSDMSYDTTMKFTYVDEERNGPYPSIFITDRYGELRKQQIISEADQIMKEKEILSLLGLLEIECPECSPL